MAVAVGRRVSVGVAVKVGGVRYTAAAARTLHGTVERINAASTSKTVFC